MTVLCSENSSAEVCKGCENKSAERYLLLLKKLVRRCCGVHGTACLYLSVNVAPKSTPDVTVFIMVFPPLR